MFLGTETIHLLWVEFLGFPLVGFAEGPGLEGAILPALFSLYVIVHDRKRWHTLSRCDSRLIIGMILASVVIGASSGYWTALGYHAFALGILVWPVVALLSPNFRAWWAYPLTFFPYLAVDFLGAGSKSHWMGTFWFGIGGAGLEDGLFCTPLITLLAALVCAYLGSLLRHYGLLKMENC